MEQEAQVKQQEKDKERNSLTGIVGPSTPVETSNISIFSLDLIINFIPLEISLESYVVLLLEMLIHL